MQPSNLKADDFRNYPAEARALAVRQLPVLRELPLSFLPLLLREAVNYDWKFPAERKELDDQFSYLHAKSEAQLRDAMAPFASLRLNDELAQFDWVNDPVQFSEKLSAWLWASHQMESFRKASIDYVHAWNAGRPSQPTAAPRLCVVAVGQQVQSTQYTLFRKLRPHGVLHTNVGPEGGFPAVLQMLSTRAQRHGTPFGHWYIDGGSGAAVPGDVTAISYNALQPARVALVEKMTKTMQPGGGGPELLRTQLAQMRPSELQLPDNGAQAILSRFQVSVLTQGSGTQIFSTTFVQWAAREALRRAQPLTLVARYAPRQREAAVQDPRATHGDLDAAGSLIDADMGAYYTWLNQQRLTGADQARFLVWFEGHAQALVTGPGWKPGTTNSDPVPLKQLLAAIS